ncbi:MAG: hypothetical protein IPK58_23860 [Acidobacteria bacterium]|nr:hypothetical protein [Acidobacteriota bacterium]
MKHLKNDLLKAFSGTFLVMGLLAILTLLSGNSFGQRDLSVITKGADLPKLNLSDACRVYNFTLTTGDLDGAEADGDVYVTINGENKSTSKILVSGGLSLRRDDQNPNSGCLDLNTNTPSIVVTWGNEGYFAETDKENWIGKHQLNNPFKRFSAIPFRIYANDVGRVTSITLHHDNWYPNWFLQHLDFSSDGREINRDVNRWFRADTLNQTFQVDPNPNLTDYRFSIQTGDVYFGGTNSSVYILLNGEGGQVFSQLDLAKMIPGNPFERNQTDFAGLYDKAPMDIRSITVTLPAGGKWFLHSIKIESPKLVRPLYFRLNDWIEGGKPVTLNPTGEVSTRKITFRNEAGYVARMMVQIVENGPGGFPIPRLITTPDMPVGQNSSIEIPNNTKDPKVFLIGVGTVKETFYISDFAGYLTSDPCFKAWGTIFSPQGGTCDGKPVATYVVPPPVVPKVLSAAEAQQLCRNQLQDMRNSLPKYKNYFDENIATGLCNGGSTELNTRVFCYTLKITEITPPNAIAECTGRIPLGSSPKINTSAPITSNSNVAQNEQDCFNQVQNKVAYDTAGNKVWNENNIKNLCRGTTDPAATISCFSQKMPRVGWSQATQECAALSSSQTQRVNKMPVPDQPVSTGLKLEGDWEMYNDKGVKFDKFAKISQSGSNLSINNGYGTNSTAVLNGATITTSDGLTGTVSADGTRIDWNIRFYWIRQASVPSTNTSGPKILGSARDVDAKNGVVFIIGTNSVPGGYGIYRFNGSGWTPIDGGAVRIAVDSAGNPWIVNSTGAVFSRNGGSWTEIPGMRDAPAADIAVAANGDVWVTTTTGLVARWTGSGWTPGRALSARQVIALPNSNTVQIVEYSGKRWTRESDDSWLIASDPTGMAGRYVEFAVDSDGTRWGIDSSLNLWRLTTGQ